MSAFETSRRRVIRLTVLAASAGGLLGASGLALAKKNEQMRTALKYQDAPNNGQKCADCMQFLPGKSAGDRGGCKVMPGDDEISPNGWCSAFVKKP